MDRIPEDVDRIPVDVDRIPVDVDYNNLVDLGIDTSIKRMEKLLIEKMETTVRELDSHRRIAEIYIGNTYISRKKATYGQFVPFDRLNPNTWSWNDIKQHRIKHSKGNCRDEFVVFCAITSETMRGSGNEKTQRNVAIAMKQRLVQYYRLTRPDRRVVNNFLFREPREEIHYAYTIYMAVGYGNNSEDGVKAQNKPKDPAKNDELLDFYQ